MARHVLLADDSQTLHRVVRDVLEGHGISLTCAENGEEALRLILESPPDLVLADLNMPRMGGFELCELLRREPHFRHIPVVFLVGPFDEYDDEAARRVGGTDHLIKPFDSFRLLAMVERYLPAERGNVSVLETTGDLEPVEELGATATVEPIDDPMLEGHMMPEVSDLADLPEPETLTRSGTAPDSEEWVALELSESEQDLSEDSGELIEAAEVAVDAEAVPVSSEADMYVMEDPALSEDSGELLDTEGLPIDEVPEVQVPEEARGGSPEPALPDSEQDTIGDAREHIRAHLARKLETIDLEQTILEVIREEVSRILPDIVDAVVRERVSELEREIEVQEQRAVDAGAEPT